MIKRTVELKASPKEVAELLFELDNKEVAEVFAHWKKLFDDNYEQMRKDKKPIHIFDLNHFLMYVVDEMDDDGKDIVRGLYTSLVYRLVGNVHKQHLTKLHLS